jgi:glycerol-3-phosphate dehydrogenase (NAD(P)+)
MVVEGVWTTAATQELSKKQGVEMPLTQKVYEVLYEGKSPRDEVTNLMQRDPTFEEASYGGYV